MYVTLPGSTTPKLRGYAPKPVNFHGNSEIYVILPEIHVNVSEMSPSKSDSAVAPHSTLSWYVQHIATHFDVRYHARLLHKPLKSGKQVDARLARPFFWSLFLQDSL